MQKGALCFTWPDGNLTLTPGDTLTVPVGLPRSYSNDSSTRLLVYVVRGGDHPRPAQWTNDSHVPVS